MKSRLFPPRFAQSERFGTERLLTLLPDPAPIRRLSPSPCATTSDGFLVVVPTIARGQELARLAASMSALRSDVLILTSGGSGATCSEYGKTIEIRPFEGRDKENTRKRLRSLSLGMPGERTGWDLPDKRNFAIRYAREEGYSVLLLLDDDIDGLTFSDVCAGHQMTEITPIFGILTGYFPDDSIIGHISCFCGDTGDRFVSGNCLFLRLDSCLGHFAGIYNEDWLFVLSSEVNGIGAFDTSRIAQRPHTKWLSTEEAFWQEPGEFITSEIADLVLGEETHLVFDHYFWKSAKGRRLEHLARLKQATGSAYFLTRVVEAAEEALRVLNSDSILEFMDKFAHDSFASRK